MSLQPSMFVIQLAIGPEHGGGDYGNYCAGSSGAHKSDYLALWNQWYDDKWRFQLNGVEYNSIAIIE